jgi:hypothetical protein
MIWAEPDEIRDRFPQGTCGYGADLSGAGDLGVARSLQQLEIPGPSAQRIRHDLHQGRCGCGREHTAARRGAGHAGIDRPAPACPGRLPGRVPARAHRAVPGPDRGRGRRGGLLAAVRSLSDRGQHLEAFYAFLYYAYLRPSVAVTLKYTDCRLPAAAGAASTWQSPPRAPARTGPMTAPPASNAASSTAPSTKPGPSLSRPSWSRCSAPTSSGTAPTRRADLPDRARRPHPGQRLQRRLARRPRRRADPRPASLPARPAALRPPARGCLPGTERRLPATEVARRSGQRHHPGSATLALYGIPCGE